MTQIVLTTSPSFGIDDAIARVGGRTAERPGVPARDETFYFEDIWIKVESTIFRVHKRNFEIESQVFKDMFATPQADHTEGASDEHPLILGGIHYQDFHPLMKVLFDREYRVDTVLTTEEWLSVLKLADIYDMARIRQKAIDMLVSPLSSDPALRIFLAIRYNIVGWLEPAVTELARRAEPLGMADYMVLGVDATVKMGTVREAYSFYCTGCPNPRSDPLNPISLQPTLSAFESHVPQKPTISMMRRDEFDFTNIVRQVFRP